MPTRARSSAARSSAAASSVRIATAPRATASPANNLPSSRVPGKAANRKPGSTARESAVMPAISGLPRRPGLAGRSAPSISLVSFNPLTLHTLWRQRLGDRGRGLIDRLHAEQWSNANDGAADRGGCGPASGRKPMARLGAMRLVDHRQDQILRCSHREDADKAREQLLFGIVLTLDFVRGAGLAADDIAWRIHHFTGPIQDDHAQQFAHVLRGLRRDHLAAFWRSTPPLTSAEAPLAICNGVSEMPCPKPIVITLTSRHFAG